MRSRPTRFSYSLGTPWKPDHLFYGVILHTRFAVSKPEVGAKLRSPQGTFVVTLFPRRTLIAQILR